jgi:UDP-3-O-[3-hydroxymyristoyl] glucosamine N-acyltransferase
MTQSIPQQPPPAAPANGRTGGPRSGRTLSEIAAAVGATVEGDGAVLITGINGIREAGPGELTYLADERYAEFLDRTRASAVIVRRDRPGSPSDRVSGAALLRVGDPEAAIQAAVAMFAPPPAHPPVGIHPTAVIHESARLGAGVAVGPHVVVEAGARIGDRCILYAGVYVGAETTLGEDCIVYPNATLRERVTVGRRVILHPNVVLGADGFGYKPGPRGLMKIPHHGTVVLEDDVELGAGTCVDRARFAETRIGAGTKIDNLVQIAHNVVVGRHTVISGMSGIAGSTVIGSGVVIGGHTGIADHVRIGDGVKLAAMTGVTKDLDGGQTYSDAPARPHRETTRLLALYRRLPEMVDRLRTLQERIDALEGRTTPSAAARGAEKGAAADGGAAAGIAER